MTSLIILNSSLTVMITIQNWLPDNYGPVFDNLSRKGFIVQQPTAVQIVQGQAAPSVRKGTTSSVFIDNLNRRVVITITNENTDPSKNISEVLDVLTLSGFPSHESIERVDIQGNITIKVEGDNSSSFVSNVVNGGFIKKVEKIFGRATRAVGIRLASSEAFTSGASKSPFYISIEPWLTDESDTKLLAGVFFATNNSNSAVQFSQGLYDRLKQTIQSFKGG